MKNGKSEVITLIDGAYAEWVNAKFSRESLGTYLERVLRKEELLVAPLVIPVLRTEEELAKVRWSGENV